MKIINTHKRILNIPKEELNHVMTSLSSKEDLMWPKEKWSPMILNNGLNINSTGGHGPIKYYISKIYPGGYIEFTFLEPEEFKGLHKFEIEELRINNCLLKHTIEMDVSIKGILIWYIVTKWLHDALIEDCFDKVQNHFYKREVETNWNFWVKILRKLIIK